MQQKNFQLVDLFNFIISNWTRERNYKNDNCDFCYYDINDNYKFLIKAYSSDKLIIISCIDIGTKEIYHMKIEYKTCIKLVNIQGIEKFLENIKKILIKQIKTNKL